MRKVTVSIPEVHMSYITLEVGNDIPEYEIKENANGPKTREALKSLKNSSVFFNTAECVILFWTHGAIGHFQLPAIPPRSDETEYLKSTLLNGQFKIPQSRNKLCFSDNAEPTTEPVKICPSRAGKSASILYSDTGP